MKLLKYALTGLICLVVVDKWAGLGFIWPETSEKPPNRPRTVPKHHPSVWDSSNVVMIADNRTLYRRPWRAG